MAIVTNTAIYTDAQCLISPPEHVQWLNQIVDPSDYPQPYYKPSDWIYLPSCTIDPKAAPNAESLERIQSVFDDVALFLKSTTPAESREELSRDFSVAEGDARQQLYSLLWSVQEEGKKSDSFVAVLREWDRAVDAELNRVAWVTASWIFHWRGDKWVKRYVVRIEFAGDTWRMMNLGLYPSQEFRIDSIEEWKSCLRDNEANLAQIRPGSEVSASLAR
jgi:hypothetical protein